jgi:hypothetical protein
MTSYRIVYEIKYKRKTVIITAASPMLALKEFKKIMPEIVYKNLSMGDVEIRDPEPEIKQEPILRLCFPFKVA